MIMQRACQRSTSAGLRPAVPRCRAPLPRHSRAPLTRSALSEDHSASPREVDVEEEVEIFMRRQAEAESGAAFTRRDPNQIIGGDIVSEERAKEYCRAILETLKTLKDTRDMTMNEVKLIVAIEDPRTRERRKLGIEDERGVSRDEMALVLVDVAEGRVPKDRLALKCLFEEIAEWPYLQVGTAPEQQTPTPSSSYSALSDPGTVAKPYVMGKEARAGDKPQTLADLLPDWVGYTALYGVSAIPVLIALGFVFVVFTSSLR